MSRIGSYPPAGTNDDEKIVTELSNLNFVSFINNNKKKNDKQNISRFYENGL